MFTAARPVRAFENVIEQVEKVILQGDLSVGDRLPSERQLQMMLDVSRNTLRESLRVLEQKGLIEIKTGNKGGIFVKEINADQMSESLALFIQSNRITLDQMAEFRKDLEGIVAARAAKQSSTETMVKINHLLEQAETIAAEGLNKWDAFMQVDKEIHLALAQLAGNPLHHFFLETVHNNIHRYHVSAYLPRSMEIIETCMHDLQSIVKAVSRGYGKLARSLAQDHVIRFNQYMENEHIKT